MVKNGYYYIPSEVATDYTGHLIVAGYEGSSGTIRKTQYLIRDAGFKWRTVAGTLSVPIFGEWKSGVTTDDLVVLNISNISFASKLGQRYANKVTPFVFYQPTDNPFSFSAGYGFAFNHILLHQNNRFTLVGVSQDGTKIETKLLIIS